MSVLLSGSTLSYGRTFTPAEELCFPVAIEARHREHPTAFEQVGARGFLSQPPKCRLGCANQLSAQHRTEL